MNQLIKHIMRYNTRYFIGTMTVIVVLLGFLKNPGFDGSFESIGIRENQYISDLKHIDSVFKEELKIVVEVIPKDSSLAVLKADMDVFKQNLEQEFDTISFRSVLDLSKLFYNHKQRRKISIGKSLNRFARVKLFQDLISKDKKTFLVILGVEDKPAEEVVSRMKKALDATTFKGVEKLNISSEFHIEDSTNSVLMHDITWIVVAILFGFLLIMIWAYRSWFSIVYMLIIVLLSLFVTFLVFALFGVSFNLITLMVLPVVIVLAVADGIHLLTGLSSKDESIPILERIQQVYDKYFVPSLLTSITTSVAFLSLSFNETQSVVHLGQITGVAVMIAFVLAYLISPYVLRKLFRPSHINKKFFIISSFFQSKIKLFSYLLMPLVFIAIFLIPKLKFLNDFEIFLPIGSEAKRQYDDINEQFYSQIAVELTFELDSSQDKKTILKSLTEKFEKLENINFVRSVQTSSVVKGKFMVPIDIAKFSGYKNRFETKDGRIQRMQIRVNDANGIQQVDKDVRAILKAHKLRNVKITSPALIFHYVDLEVAKSLIRSLLISTLFLLFVFFLLTKDIVQSLIGMFANIVPLSIIVIIFVWFDLNINIVTAVTAVVCIGLIVDDTIHAFYRRVVLNEKLEELGFGMLVTTAILVVGFGLFAISSLMPVVIFGLVSSAVFIVTLISDFTLLFYLLDNYDKFKLRKK